ncbi:MAG: type II/IV secretion system protein, partial [Candidatus Eremiobacteraeota bacterium]|nr:type II/IV secretion system protein [Candidatus Eremiobacteraeota bacterium]
MGVAELVREGRDAVARIPRRLAYELDALPLKIEDGVLVVALPERHDPKAPLALEVASRLAVRTIALPREHIRDGLRIAYEAPGGLPDRRVDDAPAVRALDAIHERAIASHASDIHLEPANSHGGGRVRLRIDGILRDEQPLAPELFAPVVSRIKLLAGMDIADRRQPQDGRYTIERAGRALDARVSSVPTFGGETLVIRLLDPTARGPRLEDLGMNGEALTRFRRAVAAPFGFIVVTGPTGSGKTTTLYATLNEIGAGNRSICSVEDPVEMRVDGVTQVQVNARSGLSFAGVLRAILRQDPNVIMIGEMRDAETAAVGLGAALSGQLVLTTLHSNDAPRTIDRLVELGLTRQAIAAALSLIVSQRLVRRLCPRCRKASGCAACDGGGYVGRTGIFELLEIGDSIRDGIAAGAS